MSWARQRQSAYVAVNAGPELVEARDPDLEAQLERELADAIALGINPDNPWAPRN